MDKLIQVSSVHKKISEMLAMYRETLSNINFYDPFAYTESLNRLFKDTILPHFEFEEKEIFPLVSVRGNLDIQATVSILQEEHKRFIDKLNRLNELKAALASNADVKEKEKLLSLCNEITRELNEHALKEDTHIFPLLKVIDHSLGAS